MAKVNVAAVRIEGETSIGRSYTAASLTKSVAGLGAQRRALRTKSFDPYQNGKVLPTLESCSMAKVNCSTASRAEILQYFHNTWQLNDTLFAALRDDSVFYAVPDKLRRPLIFYFAHPAALYANKMHQAGLMDNVHPYFQKLFETGVDEMSWDDMDAMQDEDFPWPDVADAQAFREQVKKCVEDVIARMPCPADGHPITQTSPYWALVLAFEHERIHIETSSVLIHQLPIDMVVEPAGWRTAPSYASEPSAAPANALVSAPAHTVVLGKPVDFPSFGWDNEYGKRVVEVPAFSAGKFTVSNAEFLPFVEAGGYNDRQWWVSPAGDDEGWRWRQYRNATHPSFWVAPAHPDFLKYHGGKPGMPYQKDDGHALAGTDPSWKLRVEFSIIPMPWDWPVEVNYLEAAAFLRWKAAKEGGGVSYRLPTEAEYHVIRGDPSPWAEATVGRAEGAAAVAAGTVGEGKEGAAGNGKVVEDKSAAVSEAGRVDVILQPVCPSNTNWRWHSSTPVDFYAPSPTGFHDAHGNVWQWVEDHFAPLPGFEIHYLYDDFSTPCFDGWHTMIVGGSWSSTGDQSSSFARYHFRRHFFQHLGFRYVRLGPEAAAEPYAGSATVCNLWEGGTAVSKEITDNFAPPADKLAFPWALAAPESALQYPVNLAHLVSKAYEVHVQAAGAGVGPLAPSKADASVLHIGSGLGGATFELARTFGRVVGLEKDEPKVRHARVLQHHGQFEYERIREGVLTDTALVRTPAGVDRARVSFVLADAEAGDLTVEPTLAAGFDVVVLDGIVTRVRQPLDVLAKATALTKPGGLVIVVSNNDWQPTITPRNSWLGGFKMNGEDQPTAVMLRYALKKAFAHVESVDLAKLSRHHARRFTLDIMQATVWKKHGGTGTGTANA